MNFADAAFVHVETSGDAIRSFFSESSIDRHLRV